MKHLSGQKTNESYQRHRNDLPKMTIYLINEKSYGLSILVDLYIAQSSQLEHAKCFV